MQDEIMKLLSLHRYWIYSNRMKILFEAELKKIKESGNELKNDFETAHLLYLTDFGVFKAYWYSSLYVVIEGYKEDLKIKNQNIEDLLNPDYIDYLRLFRNATFHYQKEIYPEKANKVDADDAFINWIRKIHNELGRVILAECASRFPEETRKQINQDVHNATGFDFKF